MMLWRRLTVLILELQDFLRMGRLNPPASINLFSNLSSKVSRPGDREKRRTRPNRPSLIRQTFSPDILAPALVGMFAIAAWEIFVRVTNMPPYLLPGPILVFQTLISSWGELFPSLLVTLKVTLIAFITAAISGLLISVLFTQSKWIERSFFPYAVILQTTPIVAIAPLIIMWLKNDTFLALIVCAWIVAFFPIVSNTTLGLNSVDHNLLNLFHLYRASRWQTLIYLRLPSAMPYFLGGLKISGGLALIGAVVAEFVAGTGGSQSGLAYQILMASYNLQIPRMFAALFMITLTGVLIFACLTWLSNFLLKEWHESAIKREN